MITVKITPGYEHLRKEILSIPSRFRNEGTIIQKGRNTIKTMSLDNRIVNIKSFAIPLFFNQFAYRYLRPSKARRSFEYASKLHSMGIGTPEPIAFIEYHNALGLKESFYISMQNTDCFTFRDLLDKPIQETKDLLIEFTKFTYNFHTKGVVFIDHSPGNTLISKSEKGYSFELVDLNRINFLDKPLPLHQGVDNFWRLTATDPMLEVMAKEYARLQNAEYTEVLERMKSKTHLRITEIAKKMERRNKQ